MTKKINLLIINAMTKEQFQLHIELKKEMEFSYQGTKYNLMYDKSFNGTDCIKFGPVYEEKKFDSFGDLINHARVGNCYFKNFIEDL